MSCKGRLSASARVSLPLPAAPGARRYVSEYKHMNMIRENWKAYAHTWHWIAMWAGAILVAYGILTLTVSIAVVLLKINECPI